MAINFVGNIIGDYWRLLPPWMQSNTVLYNLHSMIRFACFSLFFIGLQQRGPTKLYKWLPLLSLLIFVLNFSLIDDFFNPDSLSGNLLAGEAYILLIYCMVYYLFKLRDDELMITQEPDFWVVTGLAIYVVVNFFVFLFYGPMLNQNVQLAEDIWDVHNYAYITLCLFIAKAIYDAPRYQYSV
jgi:F0F1-type ATP synthase membrane subunit a